MSQGAQLSVTELRRSARHPVTFPVAAEHRMLGDVEVVITNISAHGFQATSTLDLSRGERLTVRLPAIGRIEAHVIWIVGERSGYQFERIIRNDDFGTMIRAMQPNPRLRRAR